MPQELQLQLSVISHAYEAEIATAISGSSSSATSQLSTPSGSISLTVASGCARGDDGSVRVQFYVSAANITQEIDGLLPSRRRLQSTPCSSTDGTFSEAQQLQCYAAACFDCLQTADSHLLWLHSDAWLREAASLSITVSKCKR